MKTPRMPDEDPEVPVDEPAEAKELVSVAASATKTSAVARAAANAKPVEAPMNKKGMTITAAADISGIASGSVLENVEQVTKAAMKRLASFPKGRSGKGSRIRQGIATFDVYDSRDDGMFQGNPDFKTDQDVLVAAASERRLKGGALTAAGGWCAPSRDHLRLLLGGVHRRHPVAPVHDGALRFHPLHEGPRLRGHLRGPRR